MRQLLFTILISYCIFVLPGMAEENKNYPNPDNIQSIVLTDSMVYSTQSSELTYVNYNNAEGIAIIHQKLDSVISQSYNESGLPLASTKWIFNYNEKGKIILMTHSQLVQGNNQWKNKEKIEISYDANDRVIQKIIFEQDSINNLWRNTFKDEYTYNDKEASYTYTPFHFDAVKNDWVYEMKFTHYLDSQGNDTLMIASELDPISGLLKNLWKDGHSHNDHLDLNSSYEWDETSQNWKIIHSIETFLNGKGNKMQFTIYNHDNAKKQWLAKYKNSFIYNEFDQLAEIYSTEWDSVTQKFVEYFKEEYVYSDIGNEVNYYTSTWDNATKNWRKNNRIISLTDGNNNLAQQINASFNVDGNEWVVLTKKDYVYNLEFAIDEITMPDNYRSDFAVNMLLQSKVSNQNNVTSSWMDSEIVNYHYSGITVVSAKQSPLTNVEVFPNPTRDIINILLPVDRRNARFYLYNMNGSLLLSELLNNNNVISLESLTNGTYVYQIIEGNEVIKRGNLIKQ